MLAARKALSKLKIPWFLHKGKVFLIVGKCMRFYTVIRRVLHSRTNGVASRQSLLPVGSLVECFSSENRKSLVLYYVLEKESLYLKVIFTADFLLWENVIGSDQDILASYQLLSQKFLSQKAVISKWKQDRGHCCALDSCAAYHAFCCLQSQKGQDSSHLYVGAHNTAAYITAGCLSPIQSTLSERMINDSVHPKEGTYISSYISHLHSPKYTKQAFFDCSRGSGWQTWIRHFYSCNIDFIKMNYIWNTWCWWWQ